MSEKEQSDPRFKKYVQLIERNLQSFDAVNEWADIISFLGKLLKSFQAYPQFKTIPHKQIVSKRLAQCLNPGFPAGVHQKTLEVYAYILETIGKDQLAEDLPLWSLGLFPFVQYAATHVKPQLLNIFEKYFYPLGTKLRPAIRGYIIALLPALEEEGSEVFHKVVSMLDQLTNVVDLPFFYSCIWLIMINDTNLRSPCLNYLLLRLPKIINKEDVALVLGGPENLGLMVRAFSATLMDHQLLVQRGILELLVQNYSLQYRTLGHEDLVLLMRSALSIVLRKDMSLNRRLYGWLLGSDSNSQNQLKYFHLYSEKATTQAIRHLFFMSQDAYQYQDTQTTNYILDAQKPYKMLISLMDKWEIGQPIVNNVFTDSLVSLQRHSKHEPIEQEILQTANMWMEIVDPYLIWKKLFNIIDQTFPKSPKSAGPGVDYSQKEGLKLVEYTLKSFKLTDEEIKQFHLPLVLAAMTKKLKKSITYVSFSDILPQIIQILEVMIIIICQLPDSVFIDRQQQNSILDENSQNIQKEFHTGMDVLEYAREFYGIKRHNKINDDNNKDNSEHIIASSATNTNPSAESAVNTPSTIIPTNHTNDINHNNSKSEEDEGDLTNQSRTNVVDEKDIITAIIRPAFGPIRGTILLKELLKNVIQFLVELVDSYIVIPENVNSGGVDVGVDGKRLYNIDKQLEKVLHRTCQLLSMIAKHVDRKQNKDNMDMNDQEQQLKADVTQALLKCCQQSKEFGVVDIGLDTLSQLIRQQRFLSGSSLKKKENTNKILDKLWLFLAPSTKLLHMRTVELIWLLTDISIQHHVESIVANYLIISNDNERVINYEKFGIFWELSENMVEASTVFSRPMFLMLDLLKDGTTPLNRRAGETWIRCHLKSYARLMEPFITTLLNQNIIRRPIKKKIPLVYQSAYPNQSSSSNHQEAIVDYFIYMRSFDMDIVDYMFTTLISLIQFGGIGVLEACKNYTVGNAGPMPLLIESGLGISTNDYPSLDFLELLVHIAIRFLESEPCEKLQSRMLTSVRKIQLHASELLYLIISKLDYVDMNITTLIQQSVVRKLLFCIASGDLDIQQKLLHLLHATMAITAAIAQGTKFSNNNNNNNNNALSPSHSLKTNDKRHHRRQTSIGYPSLFGNEGNTAQHSRLHLHHSSASSQNRSQNETALLLAQSTSNLYVKCVIDAFHTPSNRPILQHWIDFVLITLPYVKSGFRQIILPILICLCEQINLCNATVRLLMHGATADKTSTPSPTTNDYPSGGDYWHITSTAMYDHHDIPSSATQPLIQERGAVVGGPETDILMFLNGLEKLLRYGLTEKNINDDWSITKIVNDSFSKDSLITTGYILPHVENHDELWGMAQLMMQLPGYNNQILMNSNNNNSNSNLSVVTLNASSSTGTSSTATNNSTTTNQHHSTSNNDKCKPRNVLLSHLPVILHILLDVWRVFRRPNWSQDTVNIMGNAKKEAVLQSFAYAADHVKARLEYTLEKLYESCPAEVIEGFVEIFFIENPIALEYEATTEQFELVVIEVLTNIPSISPQQILTKLLESIRQRTPGMQPHRKRHTMRVGKLTDTSLLRFTEIYCQEIIKPETLSSLWPSISPFVKDYLSQASTYKTILPGLLRYMTIVVDRFVSFSDDKKARKEAQDLYQRCVDYCILIAGKSFDQSLWSRRTNIYDDDQQHDTYSTISSLSSPYPSSINASDVTSMENLSLYSQYSHHINNNNNNNNSSPNLSSNNNNNSSGEMNAIITPNLSTSSISELEKKASWKLREDYMILQINHYIATQVIPQLRHIIGDQDKINSLLNNLVYYVIGPHLRSRPPTSSMPLLQGKRLRSTPSQASLTTSSSITTHHRHHQHNNTNYTSFVSSSSPSSSSLSSSSSSSLQLLHGGTVIIDQLVEMSKMPFTYKTWRKEVWEVFSDHRFFYMTSTTANKWSTILSTVFSLEKERFTELMGRITTSPSNGAFFTNKDQETLQRALHLRRVSFVIFAGTMNQYVQQLPTIQEKMVELLKLDHSEMIHVEIYLCLRIILIRFSQKHLIHFWPVLISEMIRVFNSFITNESLDRPEEAQIALAGCKFLDLLCTLEMDSFQVYQWIFIRDTVDAVIKREEETKQVSMMSKLSDTLHKHYQSEMNTTTASDLNGSPFMLDDNQSKNNNNSNNFKALSTFHHGNNVVASTSSSSLPSVGELKRPMLTMHSIGSIVQLSFFIEHIHLYVYQSSYMLAKPDIPFIEGLLLQDLLEGDMRTD